jgi:hypothetical protein
MQGGQSISWNPFGAKRTHTLTHSHTNAPRQAGCLSQVELLTHMPCCCDMALSMVYNKHVCVVVCINLWVLKPETLFTRKTRTWTGWQLMLLTSIISTTDTMCTIQGGIGECCIFMSLGCCLVFWLLFFFLLEDILPFLFLVVGTSLIFKCVGHSVARHIMQPIR